MIRVSPWAEPAAARAAAGSLLRLARIAAILALATAAATLSPLALLAPSTAHAAAARTSLPAIEPQVMCVTCGIPLSTAESPEADRERVYIQGLIDQGMTVAQIKTAVVAQYGPAVLATPSRHGFGLLAYLVPLALALGVIGSLVVTLTHWRRRADSGANGPPGVALPSGDAARLDADLARFDG